MRAETLLFDQLELDLRSLAGNLPDNLAARLKLDEDASKLHIAAAFARLGWPLEWVSDAGGRRPEMIVAANTW